MSRNSGNGALTLTRKRGQAVVLHYPKADGTTGRVVVELANFKGSNAARLAITADADVEIWRDEIEPKRPKEQPAGLMAAGAAE